MTESRNDDEDDKYMMLLKNMNSQLIEILSISEEIYNFQGKLLVQDSCILCRFYMQIVWQFNNFSRSNVFHSAVFLVI